jgi:hypothetical protein
MGTVIERPRKNGTTAYHAQIVIKRDGIVHREGQTFDRKQVAHAWLEKREAHAKPIPVAPIREIAGVCSRGQAVPVVLAVNGYTKPALETAEELGVRCLDAHDLCKFARMETIVSIN